MISTAGRASMLRVSAQKKLMWSMAILLDAKIVTWSGVV